MTPTDPAGPRELPILQIPGVLPLLVMVVLGMMSFSILLPLSPAWAMSRGASEAVAGSVTGILMAATILTQFAMNRIIGGLGWSRVLMLGMLALGAPSILQAAASSPYLILVSSALRGIGFGILTVGGATAMALLVSAERRGAAVGLYGLAVAMPQLLFVSSAPVLEQHFGSLAMAWVATAPLVGMVFARPLGDRLDARSGPSRVGGSPVTASLPALLAVIAPVLLILLIVTGCGGVLLTFASQLTVDASSAAVVLFCVTGFAAPARWMFGVLSDRRTTAGMIGVLCLVFLAGLVAICASVLNGPSPEARLALYAGSGLLGIAYGGLQSTTLVHAFKLCGPDRIASVSVLWNVAFDLGTGLGAFIAGAIAAAAGFPVAMVTLAAVSVAGLAFSLLRIRAMKPA